jgi:hypothetical protein
MEKHRISALAIQPRHVLISGAHASPMSMTPGLVAARGDT